MEIATVLEDRLADVGDLEVQLGVVLFVLIETLANLVGLEGRPVLALFLVLDGRLVMAI